MDVLSYLLIPFQQPMLILLTAVGTFAGVYVGAIPGLSATMAVSLLVSFRNCLWRFTKRDPS